MIHHSGSGVHHIQVGAVQAILLEAYLLPQSLNQRNLGVWLTILQSHFLESFHPSRGLEYQDQEPRTF